MSDITLETSVDPDGDPVGYRWIINPQQSVWVGEISRKMFESLSDEEREAYHNDLGCFYVLFGKRKATVLGRAPDLYIGRPVALAIARGIAADPTVLNELTEEIADAVATETKP